MGLKDVNIKLIYDSSNDNIEKDLFIPLMKESNNYYRGVGFFSSIFINLKLSLFYPVYAKKNKISQKNHGTISRIWYNTP